MTSVGVTGTRNEITTKQIIRGIELLKLYYEKDDSFLHHGCCIGVDATMAIAALTIGYRLHAFPGPYSQYFSKLAYDISEIRHEQNDFLDRNKTIIDYSQFLIEFPARMGEELRSGTWATVRYAEKHNVSVIVVFPDGSIGRRT